MIKALGFKHHSLGIEITDTHVKLCQLQLGGREHLRVIKYAATELAEGTMNDGRIQDEKLLLQAFRTALIGFSWSTKYVHFAIPSQSVMVRFLKLPHVKDKMLRKIVDIEIKNNIHLPFDDPHYDFIKLDTATPDGLCHVMLTAASMELLQQYMRIFRELGLQLKSMEIKAFSLNRILQKYMNSPSQELCLIADINGTSSDLTIVNKGIIEITRNVPTAFIPQMTQNRDTIDQMFLDFLPQKDNYDASFSDLAGEMERLINFYRYTLNHRDAEFTHLLVSGDIPMLDDLVHYLSGRMSMRVTVLHGETFEAESFSGNWSLPYYAVPLGLCLRGKQ